MSNETQQTSAWKRFEDGERKTRDNSEAPSGSQWAVIWDDQETHKVHFASYPRSWGGSGWYADPVDIITLPEGIEI